MTKPDWIFLGWKINDDDTLYEEKVTLEARAYDEDITLTAIWGPLMYMNVNIDADFTSPDDTRIPTEMEFALKVVDQPRYNTTFTATYDAEKKALVADIASLGEEFNIELQSYTINGKTYEQDDPFIDYFTYDTGNQTRGEGRYITFSQTLKEWINTVTYNEGNTFGETVEGVPGEFSVWRHHPSTLVTGTPTTRGYTFAGWKSAKDGKVYQPGDAYSTDTIQDDTLTAQWTVNTYKITYTGLEEATVDGDLPSVYAYDQATVVKNAITKDKYRFLGWKINGGEDVSATPTTLEAKKYTEDITLDAVWGYVTKINVDVSTWFTSNNEARYPEEIEFRLIVDGDESNPILFTASFDKTTKTYTTTYEALGDHFVIAPTRYKIDGVWHDATSDKSKYFTYQEVSVEKGQDTAIKFNEKLDEVVNLLSYHEGDTSNEAVENVPESEKIWLYTAANVASETPTSRGFTFSGWKSEKLDTVFQPGESYPTDTEISDDTLTAQWNPNEYKIKYAGLKDASVQGEQPETYVFNTGASVDCHPTKDGYDFQGWQILNDDDDTTYDSVVDLPAKKYAEDITLNAVWSPSANDKAETVNYVGEENTGDINNNRQNREFAIVNLIFVIGALMAAILCGLKRTKWWKLDVALTAVAVVLFILTTGYDKVVLFNTWTIVFVALFALSFLPPMRAKLSNS